MEKPRETKGREISQVILILLDTTGIQNYIFADSRLDEQYWR